MFDRISAPLYGSYAQKVRSLISVPGLVYSEGLATCASNKCLYASDYRNDCVHRVELTGRNAVTKWSVGDGPGGLTVNSDKNVVVLLQGEHKLQEFSSRLTELHYRPFCYNEVLRIPDKLSSYPVASL